MKTDWLRELRTDEEKQERLAELRANRAALDYLKVVLERKIVDLDVQRDSKQNYERPNWALEQADFIGRRRTLNEILDLVTLEKE